MNSDEYNRDTEKILDHFTVREILGDWEFYVEGCDYCDGAVLMYRGCLYIEILDDEYDLVLDNMEWTSQCLFELEEKLARYAVEEGHVRSELLTELEECRGHDYYEDCCPHEIEMDMQMTKAALDFTREQVSKLEKEWESLATQLISCRR